MELVDIKETIFEKQEITESFLRNWLEIQEQIKLSGNNLDMWHKLAVEITKPKKWLKEGKVIEGFEEDGTRTWFGTEEIDNNNPGWEIRTFQIDKIDNNGKIINTLDGFVAKENGITQKINLNVKLGDNNVKWEIDK